MSRRQLSLEVPAWARAALDVPRRLPDMALILDRLDADPSLLAARVVPAIDKACANLAPEDPDGWRTHQLRLIVRTCLMDAPEQVRSASEATASIAARTADVGAAAEALLAALARLEGARRLAKAAGVEPALLPVGVDFGIVVPGLDALLKEVARRASNSGQRPEHARPYALTPHLVRQIDRTLEFRLPHGAMVDCVALFAGLETDASAVAKAREPEVRRADS